MRTGVTVQTWSSWGEITDHYQSFIEHGYPYTPILEFAHQVALSPYAQGLYPAMSMLTLLIGQTPDFEWMREVIHVEYLPKAGRFRFDFWESPYAERHWSKECGPAEAFGVFERLLRAKRWFLGVGPVAEAGTRAV